MKLWFEGRCQVLGHWLSDTGLDTPQGFYREKGVAKIGPPFLEGKTIGLPNDFLVGFSIAKTMSARIGKVEIQEYEERSRYTQFVCATLFVNKHYVNVIKLRNARVTESNGANDREDLLKRTCVLKNGYMSEVT